MDARVHSIQAAGHTHENSNADHLSVKGENAISRITASITHFTARYTRLRAGVYTGRNGAKKITPIAVPPTASKRAMAREPAKYKAIAASHALTGSTHRREHTALASQLPSCSIRASREVSSTLRYWRLAARASPNAAIARRLASS